MKGNLHRVSLDLAPTTMERLERCKRETDAQSYAEVIRAALREYELKIFTQPLHTNRATTVET